MTVPPCAGLVLAAGAATRFGGGKALASWHGRSLLDLAVSALRDGGCTPVLVVTGADAAVAAAAADLGAVVVDNPAWAEGMSTSLRAGLTAVSADVSGAVVVLADQPRVSGAAVARVAGAIASGALAARASYGGTAGHPVGLSRRIFADVATAAHGDTGAGPWLRAHAEDVVDVDCTGLGDPTDVDTRADLDR